MSHTRSNSSWRPWKMLLFAGLLALCLTGCAKQQAAPPALSYTEMLAMMNQPVENDLSQALSYVPWVGAYDGRVWACGAQAGGFENIAQMEMWVASVEPTGQDLRSQQLSCQPSEEMLQLQTEYLTQNPEGSCFTFHELLQVAFDKDGRPHPLLLDELLTTDKTTGEFVRVVPGRYTLCTIDEHGNLQRGPRLQMPEDEGLFDCRQVQYVGEDVVWGWITAPIGQEIRSSQLLQFSAADGSCKTMLPLPENVYALDWIPLQNGDLLLCTKHSTTHVSELLVVQGAGGDTPTLGECQPLPEHIQCLTGGFVKPISGQPMDEIYLHSSKGLHRYQPEQQTVTDLLQWEEYGVDGAQVMWVFCTGEESFLTLDPRHKMRRITLIDADALAGRPMVTLGVLDHPNLEELKAQVTAYNAAGPAVYVGIVPYTNAAAAEKGFSSGGEQLYNDILRGSAPDILLLPNDMDIDGLVGKGVFIDLYPYLDADAELARDDFVPGILSACAYNGTLPTVVPSYTLLTAAGSAALVGDTPGWAWQDYDALLAAHPDAVPFYGFARQNILLYLLQMGGDAFIDRQSGQAHLASPDFVRLLQASAAYPTQAADLTQDPKPAFSDGEALLQVQFVTKWRDVLTLAYLFDGDFTFKGFPGAGTGNPTGSAVVPALRLGVTRYCQDPQAAWQFLRTLLLPGYQDKLAAPDSTAFPLRQDSLAAAAATATRPYEGATPPLFLESADLTDSQLAHWQQGLTQAQADGLSALLGAQTTLYQYDATIAAIVWEEAEAFYNGQRPAAEAAALMQARVQTYLDENG